MLNAKPFLQLLKALPTLILLNLLGSWTEEILNHQIASQMKTESWSAVFLIGGMALSSLAFWWISLSIFLLQADKTNRKNDRTEEINGLEGAIAAPTPIPVVQNSVMTRLQDVFREGVKAMGSASLWSLVFVVPGIYRLVQYSLLPFVVFFDSSYQSGEAEALSRTILYTKGIQLRLLGIWMLFILILPLMLTALSSNHDSFLTTPLAATLVSCLHSVLDFLSLYLLWRLFIKQRLVLTQVSRIP